MKLSARILLSMLIVLVAGLLLSNVILKKEYNKIDKSDLHWNYTSILTEHFKYLKIDGGNNTKIAFEQNKNCSVRVLNDWQRYHPELIKSFVKDDTLFIKFVHAGNNQNEKDWMQWTTLVRIFSPELLFVEGVNTNLGMFTLKQKSIVVNISGKSAFEVESMIPDMDSIIVFQKDSASVEFEMSPDYRSKKRKDTIVNKGAQIPFDANPITPDTVLNDIKSDEAMNINSVNATVEGYSILDLGHAQIGSLQLNIADSSAIILSGGTLKKMGK